MAAEEIYAIAPAANMTEGLKKIVILENFDSVQERKEKNQ